MLYNVNVKNHKNNKIDSEKTRENQLYKIRYVERVKVRGELPYSAFNSIKYANKYSSRFYDNIPIADDICELFGVVRQKDFDTSYLRRKK